MSWWTRLFGFGELLVPAFGSFWVFGSAFLPGPATLEGFLLRWALPGRGKENSKVRPSTRAGGATIVDDDLAPLAYGLSPRVRGNPLAGNTDHR